VGRRVCRGDLQPHGNTRDFPVSELENGRHTKFFGVEPNHGPTCTYHGQVLESGKTLVLRNLRKQELNATYAELTAGAFLIQSTVHNVGNSYDVTSLCIGK
jgi:hypothetical protein